MNMFKMLAFIIPGIALILVAGGLDLKNEFLEYAISLIMVVIGAGLLILLGKNLRDEELKK